MASYAEVLDGKVVQVIEMNGPEVNALLWLNDNVSKNEWILTKKDINGEKYAGIGDDYHPDIKVFLHKPFKSWVLDREKKMYLPPYPRPVALVVGYVYKWSRSVKDWVLEKVGKK